jgi:ribonuclease-3
MSGIYNTSDRFDYAEIQLQGYVFNDLRLLRQALMHSSFVYEQDMGGNACNERLEFLGDAVLGMIISEILYDRFPDLTEGELSKARANLVCEPTLAAHARSLKLGKYMRLGRGEMVGGGTDKDSILSDATEAVIAAIFLDGGIEKAREFVHSLYADIPIDVTSSPIDDPKSTLQEKMQKSGRPVPVYNIVSETGPPHRKKFVSSVAIEGRILGKGTGRSKKDAEREAAAIALRKLNDGR